jgi:hypothetical protein
VNIFLSYSSKDRKVAEAISLAIGGIGHRVFFDRESLPPGGDYHARIRKAIFESDAFVYLISPDSVQPGSYTLTELKYAREKWPHPKDRVIPVLIRDTAWDLIPVYLKAVTVLEVEGNPPAEVAQAVSKMEHIGVREQQRTAIPAISSVTPMEDFMGDTGQMFEVSFSPDNKLLATWGFDYRIHLWDLWLRRLRRELEPWPGAYGEPRFAPDSTSIIVLSGSNIHVCQLSLGRWSTVWAPDGHAYLPSETFAISPAGDLLVAGWNDYEGRWQDGLLIFRMVDWKLQVHLRLEAPEDAVRCLTFSPDGTKLAVVLDSSVQVLSIPAYEALQIHRGPPGEMLTQAAFSADGAHVASSSGGGSAVDVFRSKDGGAVQRLEAHIGGVAYVGFLGATGILVTAGLKDGLVRFWHAFDGTLLTTAEVAKQGVFGFALSADNSLFATGGNEGDCEKSIRLWRIR